MNVQIKKPRPTAIGTGANEENNNQIYFTTDDMKCKVLVSILGRDDVVERLWIEYVDEHETDTEDVVKAGKAFSGAISGIEDVQLLLTLEDLDCGYGAAMERQGFYAGFRSALHFVFGGGGHED